MRQLFAGVLSLIFVLLFTAAGCGDDKQLPDDFGPGGGRGDGGDADLICLLNNCTEDFHCKDCTGTRTTCEKSSRRCIACGPAAGNKTCPNGYSCTKYGDCVPEGTTCSEDQNAVPNVVCTTDASCAACAPQFRVCDPQTKKCGGCTATNVTQCQKTEYCKDSKCVAKCPDCTTDAECGQCGAGPRAAKMCVRGKCAQCNPENNSGCPAGLSCTARGSCQSICGRGGRTAGGPKCLNDNDCGGCKSEKKCDIPINGGFGKCAVPAPGCSELAKGVFVLPDPYAKFTNLCSTDTDCKDQGIDFNVGKELREFSGVPFIGDANASYGMNVCASVDIIGTKSCGVCVPCRKDADCKPLDVEALGGKLAGSLGKAAVAKTMDALFGKSDHKVHFYCENIAGDYGICLPCGNPLSTCGSAPAPASKAGDHSLCTTGGPLGAQCNACTTAVCDKDPYCCTSTWDAECVKKTDDVCKGFASCAGQSCADKADGWYCSETVEAGTNNRGLGTYKCAGGSIAQGNSCPNANRGDQGTDKYCHPLGGDWKKSAELGSDATPKCFATPATSPNDLACVQ